LIAEDIPTALGHMTDVESKGNEEVSAEHSVNEGGGASVHSNVGGIGLLRTNPDGLASCSSRAQVGLVISPEDEAVPRHVCQVLAPRSALVDVFPTQESR
jgi:hypothetical protein